MPYHTHATRDILKLDEIHQFIMDNFVAAGYGGISLATPTPLLDIGVTWQKIPFDTASIAVPKGVTYDLPSNAVQIDSVGVWTMMVNVTLSFTEVNAGRTLQFRLWNSTDTVGTTPVSAFVGRNTSGYTASFSFIVELDTWVGDPITLEVSSPADTFTTAQVESASWSLSHSSEYKGELP